MSKRGIKFTQKSLTQQSFRNECDLNKIVERFSATGQLPQSARPVRYGLPDGEFHTNQLLLAEAKSLFETLPTQVKEKYGNAGNVITSLNDADLASELHEDGIFNHFGIEAPPIPENAPKGATTAPDTGENNEVIVEDSAQPESVED